VTFVRTSQGILCDGGNKGLGVEPKAEKTDIPT